MPMIRRSDFGQTISTILVPVVGTDNRAPREAHHGEPGLRKSLEIMNDDGLGERFSRSALPFLFSPCYRA
jgi:hypothetical protein